MMTDLVVYPRDVTKGDHLRCRYRGDMLVAWNSNADGRTEAVDLWVTVMNVKLTNGYYTINVRKSDAEKPVVLGPYGGRTQLTVHRDDPTPVTGLLNGSVGVASVYVSLVVTGPDGKKYQAEITDEFEVKLRDVTI